MLFLTAMVHAQSPLDHWYFGPGHGIKFENGVPVADNDAAVKSFLGSVSMSDSAGNLLFYSNGAIFYNRNHEKMLGTIGGPDGSFTVDIIAMPSTTDPDIYFAYATYSNSVYQYRIDMSANNGLGDAVVEDRISATQTVKGITAIKSLEDQGYWLLTVERAGINGKIVTWKVDGSTGNFQRHSSLEINTNLSPFIWEIATSPNGEQLAIITSNAAYVADFDPVCGQTTDFYSITAPDTGFDPFGACFSPNGAFLYLSYYAGQFPNVGRLYQLETDNVSESLRNLTFLTTPYALKGMLNGPDAKMYINTNDVQNDQPGVDRLSNPNTSWQDIWPNDTYEKRVIALGDKQTYNPNFPNFITDRRESSQRTAAPIKSFWSFCDGDSFELQLNGDAVFDSLVLLDSHNQAYQFRRDNSPLEKVALDTGIHILKVNWARCGLWRSSDIEVRVGTRPKVVVNDTSICLGDTLVFGPDTPWVQREFAIKRQGTWIPISGIRLSEAAQYRITEFQNGCSGADSFTLGNYPSLLTELGGPYTFCEQAGNTIKLDAGPKFDAYKWYPTEDTTQWIHVKKSGDYYVVVSDSKGCRGRGDATIESECVPTIYVPNAFSPNGDGLNDFFEVLGEYTIIDRLVVFDRWGSIIYYEEGSNPRWDGIKHGEQLPLGVYQYIVTHHKAFENTPSETLVGKVHLVK